MPIRIRGAVGTRFAGSTLRASVLFTRVWHATCLRTQRAKVVARERFSHVLPVALALCSCYPANAMSKRIKAWARRTLEALRTKHGNRCRHCGRTQQELQEDWLASVAEGSTKRQCWWMLELDCVEPQGDTHHKMSTDQRATFYRMQDAAGNLQLLCSPCHAKKTEQDLIQEAVATLNAPF